MPSEIEAQRIQKTKIIRRQVTITLVTRSTYLFTDNATEEQRREFLSEIELMKEIGRHQNVLSFIGCWTTTKPLLLIIEYVAHGDLRQWLIRKRKQVDFITFILSRCLAVFFGNTYTTKKSWAVSYT